jgi:hypothetical protein
MWRALSYSTWPEPGYYWYRFRRSAPSMCHVFLDHIDFGATSQPVYRKSTTQYAGLYWLHMPKLVPPLWLVG